MRSRARGCQCCCWSQQSKTREGAETVLGSRQRPRPPSIGVQSSSFPPPRLSRSRLPLRSFRCDSSNCRPRSVRMTTPWRWPGNGTVRMSPCSRRCRRSPLRGSADRPSWSRKSRDDTTRNVPTMLSVRDSEPRMLYWRSRSRTSARSSPRGRSCPGMRLGDRPDRVRGSRHRVGGDRHPSEGRRT